ncbi:MAG: 16S rRNA (cytosine(1402)-N(4))-methyltransferase RsmH [gamma proteobacterium endosymbiont of Trioza apicalis]
MHNTVLLNESIKGLNINPGGIYFDCTFGFGGHSRLILSKLNKNGKLFAIDCDPDAITYSLNINNSCFNIQHGCFSNILDYALKLNLFGKVNGILLDLGLSSMQIDNSNRGFSFINDGPLDMRMNYTCGQTAAQWLSNARVEDIFNVLKNFGEERFAKLISNAIVNQNINKPITRTLQLSKLITNIVPFYEKYKHPATRTFQAIRIYINNEFEKIKNVLNDSFKILAPKGRLVVISFHSLEHKLIKFFISNYSSKSELTIGCPIIKLNILNKLNINKKLKLIKKIQPSYKEVINNFCSRSAILHIIEKKFL